MGRCTLVGLVCVACVVTAGCGKSGSSNSFNDGGLGVSDDAGSGGRVGSGGTGGEPPSSGGAPSNGGTGGTPSTGNDAGDASAAVDASDATDAGVPTACGAVERCEIDFVGTDDDCDGEVDEICQCLPGQASDCFMGDPAYLSVAGCFPGTQTCTESGAFGPCVGGAHAVPPDNCFEATPDCHAIEALPFVTTDLSTGIGTFGAGADPGSESFTVTCPGGVEPCPAVSGTADFVALSAGEYAVTYTRSVAGSAGSCTYPLLVRSIGFRAELSWDLPLAAGGVDLDLHVHRPNDTSAWSGDVVCNYLNCTGVAFFQLVDQLTWFAEPPAAPPDPVNWYLDPVFENNTCYFTPHGQYWQDIDRGCHNPRLDRDRINCDASITDPINVSFCGPENINMDFPPLGQWFRIAVHYFNRNGETADVHPRVKVFCGGSLAADLGPSGYYLPSAPVTFPQSDSTTRFWLVADVQFPSSQADCVVQPLYGDTATRTPYLSTRTQPPDFPTAFGPPYPATP